MSDHEEPDPLLDEIQRIRAQIWQEHGNDVHRVVQHYVEYQKQFEGQLVSHSWTPDEELAFRKGLEELSRLTPEDLDRMVAEERSESLPLPPAPAYRKQDKSAA